MPPLILNQWINGQVKPGDLKGKVVLVDFYATWCEPCMESIPHLNELQAKYKGKGLIVIGACTSPHGQEQFAANARQHGIQYPAARDTGEVSSKAWQASYYPTCALVDRKGIVRVIGLDPSHVEEVVGKLLAEPAP